MTELMWTTGKEWRFKLTADFTVDLKLGMTGFHDFYDDDTCWAILRDDVLTIKAGYAFNGASPAWYIFGRWVGTPTPAPMRIPSLVHDVLWQFAPLKCCPWDYRQANDVFFNLMRDGKFPLKRTYHGAVHYLGSLYRRFAAAPDSISCYTHLEKP